MGRVQKLNNHSEKLLKLALCSRKECLHFVLIALIDIVDDLVIHISKIPLQTPQGDVKSR